MPIRHCQKCGLKVLIDDSLMSVNPFYCQRCAAVAKGPDEAPAVPAATPTPAPAAPAPLAASPAKGAALKVACPYCKASFTGRVPAKPAKGACPVCHKDLILLPDGGIRPSQGFDLASWQKEQAAKSSAPAAPAEPAKAEPPVVPSRIEGRGTRIVKKPPNIAITASADAKPPEDDLALPSDLGGETMLDMGRSSGKPAAKPGTSEVDEAFPSEMGGETMLDMGRSSPKAPPSKPAASEVEEAFPSDLGGETMLDMGRSSPKPPPLKAPPSEVEEAFPSDVGGETMLDMGRSSPKPPPLKTPASEVEEAFPSDLGGETMLDMGRGSKAPPLPPMAPQETQEAFPTGMGGARETLLDLDGVPRPPVGGAPPPPPPRPPLPPPQIVEDEEPPPAPEPEPDPAPSPEPVPVAKLPPPVASAVGGRAPSKGRVVAAYAMVILPLLAAVIFSFLTDSPAIQDLFTRIDTVATRGFFELRSKVTGAAPPADLPKESPTITPSKTPTPPPSQSPSPTPSKTVTPTPTPTPSEDPNKARKELEGSMTDLYIKFKKLERDANKLDKDPTADQKVMIETWRKEAATLRQKFDGLQRQYVELYGSKFSPENQ